MRDKVSVIVPVYKTEKYLEKCLESILNQTYEYLEIILVDDGSPDNSGVICDIYAGRDSRIKVIHKANGGLSDARNAGLEECTGKFTVFCDSDDWMETDTIKKAIEEKNKSNADLVVWGYGTDYVNDNDIVVNTDFCTAKEDIFAGNADGLSHKNVIGLLGYAWNKLYPTVLLKDNHIRFEKGTSLIEDILFNSQVIDYCHYIKIIDFCGTHYVHRGNVTLGNSFYDNFGHLVNRSINASISIMEHFGLDQSKIQLMASKQIMTATKYGLFQIFDDDTITSINKLKRIKQFTKDISIQSITKSNESYYGKNIILIKMVHNKMNMALFISMYFHRKSQKIVRIIKNFMRRQ